jgi:energy-coupling factor transporter ATP-binding protein EcfA2
METKKSPILLSDAPVGLQGDLIWKESDINLDIEMISETILQSEEPLVFAVHGPWGSGKSSFLKMIEGSLKRDKGDQRIFVCWYIASHFQTVGDASTTLTLRILRELRGRAEDGDMTASMEHLVETLFKPSIVASGVTGEYGFLEELASQVAVLADLGIVIERFLDGGVTAGKSKLVLIVDDLDRCSLEFIGNLMETIQRLSSVKNMFIILAVDRARLHNALEKRFEDVSLDRGPQWASEKYIQHAIELPPLDDKQLKSFILHALEKGNQDRFDDPALETIRQATDYFIDSVHHKIPRTIKSCINLIRPTLTREVKRNPSLSEDDQRRIIKTRLVEYLFRDFYTNWLQKALANRNSPEFRFLAELEDECIKQFGDKLAPSDIAMLSFSIERIKASNLLTDRELEVPQELAKLLASPPYFAYEKALVEQLGKQNVIEDFIGLYEQAMEAYQSRDAEGYRMAAAQAHDLAKNNRSSLGNAPVLLGDLASGAEDFKMLELSYRLSRLALEVDPTNVNNMLIYSSYIINNRRDMIQDAKSYLQTVITKYPQHEKIGQAYVLSIRIDQLLGEPVDDDMAQLTEVAKRITRPDKQLELLTSMITNELAPNAVYLFQRILAPNNGSAKVNYELQAELAYELSDRGREYDNIALDLYRQLVNASDLADAVRLSVVQYSYARLLHQYGYDQEASRLFHESYLLRSESMSNRRLYSNFLEEMGRNDLSEIVASGGPLDIEEPVEPPTSREIPQRFSQAVSLNIFEDE